MASGLQNALTTISNLSYGGYLTPDQISAMIQERVFLDASDRPMDKRETSAKLKALILAVVAVLKHVNLVKRAEREENANFQTVFKKAFDFSGWKPRHIKTAKIGALSGKQIHDCLKTDPRFEKCKGEAPLSEDDAKELLKPLLLAVCSLDTQLLALESGVALPPPEITLPTSPKPAKETFVMVGSLTASQISNFIMQGTLGKPSSDPLNEFEVKERLKLLSSLVIQVVHHLEEVRGIQREEEASLEDSLAIKEAFTKALHYCQWKPSPFPSPERGKLSGKEIFSAFQKADFIFTKDEIGVPLCEEETLKLMGILLDIGNSLKIQRAFLKNEFL